MAQFSKTTLCHAKNSQSVIVTIKHEQNKEPELTTDVQSQLQTMCRCFRKATAIVSSKTFIKLNSTLIRAAKCPVDNVIIFEGAFFDQWCQIGIIKRYLRGMVKNLEAIPETRIHWAFMKHKNLWNGMVPGKFRGYGKQKVWTQMLVLKELTKKTDRNNLTACQILHVGRSWFGKFVAAICNVS